MPYNSQFDLRGKRIQDTYTQVLQYDTSSGISYTGQGSSVNTSASYALSASYAPSAPSISSSYATTSSFAVSASWAPFTDTGTTLVTASTYPITASWAISASWAPDQTVTVNSASWASASFTSTSASLAKTASFVTASNVIGMVTSASYAKNASSASYINGTGETLSLNGTLTTPQANTNALVVDGIGFYNNGSITILCEEATANVIITQGGFKVQDGSSVDLFTVNGSDGSVVALNVSCSTITSSFFYGTSSWSNKSISSSYTNTASFYGGSVVSASFASQSISASWAPTIVQVSSSWASASLSSSFIRDTNIYYPLGTATGTSITVNFNSTTSVLTMSVTADTSFTSSNRTANIAKNLTYVMSGDTVDRNLAFESGWNWFVTTPTKITANKKALLTFTCVGTAVTDVYVAYKESV